MPGRHPNEDITYKFDLCNPNLSCEEQSDLVHSEAAVGYLETSVNNGRTFCKKIEDFTNYQMVETKTGHDLKFTTKHACTENHYPKDQTTIFRLTCDWDADSRAPFTEVKNNSPCTRIFETVSIDA